MSSKFFQRRVHLIRRFPETGFVIFNPKAEKDGLRFYSKTVNSKSARTTYWCETADQAKVFDKEASAKAVLSKMKKRNQNYSECQVVTIESQMLDGFEIDMHTGNVRPCKAWPFEFESKAVFKTKMDALIYEKDYKMKEKASYILQVQKYSKDIEELEKEISVEVMKKKKGA